MYRICDWILSITDYNNTVHMVSCAISMWSGCASCNFAMAHIATKLRLFRVNRTISRAACQCFPRQDMFLILLILLAQGSVTRNTVPWVVFPNTLPRWSRECIGKYNRCWSYNLISSLLQVNIKKYIRTVQWVLTVSKSILTLIMMRECVCTITCTVHIHVVVPNGCEGLNIRNA